MSDNEIKKAVEFCCNNKTTCRGCPLYDVEYECGVYLSKYIRKNEPAPAEAETSSKEKYLQEYNTSVSGVCQVEAITNLFYHAARACKSMIDTYDNMTCEEQRAFDLGETYRDMLSVRNDLEKLMKAGEQA